MHQQFLLEQQHLLWIDVASLDCQGGLVWILDGLRPAAPFRPTESELQHPIRPNSWSVQGKQ